MSRPNGWANAILRRPLGAVSALGMRHRMWTLVFLSTVVFHAWHAAWRHHREAAESASTSAALAAAATLALALVAATDRRRLGLWLAATTSFLRALIAFPNTYNHLYLEVLLLIVLAAFDPADDADPEEHAAALGATLWLGLLAIFWSGVQKVLYGTYFKGQYLTYLIATDERFRDAFWWLLPAGEQARIEGIGPAQLGASGYESTWWPMLAASNLVWMAEIALPVVFVCVARARPAATIALLVLFVAIEVAAREFVFGLMIVHILALAWPRPIHRRVLWPSLAVLGALAVTHLLFPEWLFN